MAIDFYKIPEQKMYIFISICMMIYKNNMMGEPLGLKQFVHESTEKV